MAQPQGVGVHPYLSHDPEIHRQAEKTKLSMKAKHYGKGDYFPGQISGPEGEDWVAKAVWGNRYRKGASTHETWPQNLLLLSPVPPSLWSLSFTAAKWAL